MKVEKEKFDSLLGKLIAAKPIKNAEIKSAIIYLSNQPPLSHDGGDRAADDGGSSVSDGGAL